MPAPRSIAITFDGSDQLGSTPLWAWQANQLTLVCDVSGVTLITGAVSIAAQIHTTAVAAGATPLASQTVAAAADEVTFDFLTADMAFSIGSGVVAAIRYLFITALDAAGDELQTLFARKIEIKAASHSELDPNPAAASTVLRLLEDHSADGYIAVTAGGTTYNLLIGTPS